MTQQAILTITGSDGSGGSGLQADIRCISELGGKVTSASYAGGSGKAASDASLKMRCEDAARKSSFSVKKSTTTNGIGTITYIIK